MDYNRMINTKLFLFITEAERNMLRQDIQQSNTLWASNRVFSGVDIFARVDIVWGCESTEESEDGGNYKTKDDNFAEDWSTRT